LSGGSPDPSSEPAADTASETAAATEAATETAAEDGEVILVTNAAFCRLFKDQIFSSAE
jgi:hypothetical protein